MPKYIKKVGTGKNARYYYNEPKNDKNIEKHAKRILKQELLSLNDSWKRIDTMLKKRGVKEEYIDAIRKMYDKNMKEAEKKTDFKKFDKEINKFANDYKNRDWVTGGKNEWKRKNYLNSIAQFAKKNNIPYDLVVNEIIKKTGEK